MKKITINKPKKLKDKILEMQTNETLFIPYRQYTDMHVRHTVRKINKDGHAFKATSAGVIDGINVIRLK